MINHYYQLQYHYQASTHQGHFLKWFSTTSPVRLEVTLVVINVKLVKWKSSASDNTAG